MCGLICSNAKAIGFNNKNFEITIFVTNGEVGDFQCKSMQADLVFMTQLNILAWTIDVSG